MQEVIKPRLRGVSHQFAFFGAIVAGLGLLSIAPTGRAMLAAGVYAIALMGLYGISALYHRVDWQPKARMRMRRLDHSMIFCFIAGCYTPICLLALSPEVGRPLLTMAWIGAALGVGRALLWPMAPKAISASLYVLLGALVLAYWPPVAAAVGALGMGLLIASGVLYVLGAIAYASHRPNPIPHVFGYHEVFHALVIVASICHFIVVVRVVLGAS